MLYVFYGTDVIKVREAAWEKVKAAEADGEAVEVIDASTYEEGMVRDAAGAVSLFGAAGAVLIDATEGNEALTSEVRDTAPALAEAERTFVLMLPKLLAADKKYYDKHAASLTEIAAVAEKKVDTFALADALAQKDKKRLWLLYQELSRDGAAAEEIIGILWWQLKTLQLAAKTATAAEAGMKDYPYKKAKAALAKFAPGEVETLSLSLLTLYHRGHGGEVDINEALELWLLEV